MVIFNSLFSRTIHKVSGVTCNPDNAVLFGLILSTIIFRYLTALVIEPFPDATGYWFCAKKILLNLPYGEWFHRSARFGIIFPVFLMQKIFGTHPVVYYFTPFFMSLLLTIFLYKTGLNLYSRLTGFFAAGIIIIFPQMIRSGSQILPGVFSATYVIISFYLLTESIRHKNSRCILILSSIVLFIAYQATITNLYFFPAFLIVLWIRKKTISDLFIFSGILFVLFIIETASYHLSGISDLGRLGIIFQSHVGKVSAGHPLTFYPEFSIGVLLKRFTSLKGTWSLMMICYAAASIFLFIKNKKKYADILIPPLVFFFFMTVVVKSYDPYIPYTRNLTRYLTVVTPFLSLIISAAIVELIILSRYIPKLHYKHLKNKKLPLILLYIFMMFCVIIVGIPAIGKFSPLNNVPIVNAFHKISNQAFEQGTPIIDKFPRPNNHFNALKFIYLDDYPYSSKDVIHQSYKYEYLKGKKIEGLPDNYRMLIKKNFIGSNINTQMLRSNHHKIVCVIRKGYPLCFTLKYMKLSEYMNL